MTQDIQTFDFSVDLLKALLWQYNEAPNLRSLLESKAEWYDKNQTEFWEDWIHDVFNLATANDFGLNVWAIILGQPIYVNSGPSPLSKPTWGFGEFRMNFTRGNFSSTTGNTYQLPTEIARLLLQLRYVQLISSGTVPEINRFMKQIFSNYGPVYLFDNLDMTQRYFFGFPLTSNIKYLLDNFDVLPRPAAVKSTYIEGSRAYWGFGAYRKNFTNGNFQRE